VGAYFVRRILIAIPVLVGITIAAFFVLAAAPGDPVLARMDPEILSRMTDAQLAEIRHNLGLDQPIPIRYIVWLGGVVHGDFGYSIVSGRSIVDEVLPRLGPSLLLTSTAAVLAVIIGVPFGVLSAINQYGKLDYILSAFTIGVISTPTFVLGLVFLFLFGVSLRWLPVGELYTFGKEGDVVDRAAHLVMPALILGLANAAPLQRYTRSTMLEVMGSDYITTARSKGIGGRAVLIRHGLRNALIPIITLVAILLPNLVAQAVVTESVFNWPGIGTLLLTGIKQRDYAMVQGTVLFVSLLFILANLIVDISYGVLDPRIRA
jgi:peptide/nickel transport system permease protein